MIFLIIYFNDKETMVLMTKQYNYLTMKGLYFQLISIKFIILIIVVIAVEIVLIY